MQGRFLLGQDEGRLHPSDQVDLTLASVRAALEIWDVSLGEDAEYEEVALRTAVLLRAVIALMNHLTPDSRVLLPEAPFLTGRE
jgi:hypothetical protein